MVPPDTGMTAGANDDPGRCLNCGYSPVGAWCPRCGQRTWAHRFSLPGLLRRALDEGFNWDRGLWFTVRGLSLQPGTSIRQYLSGRTRPYTSPIRYLLVAVVLATLMYRLSGLMDVQIPVAEADEPESLAFLIADKMMEWNQRYFNVLLIASVPILAVMSWLLFWPSRRTLAEHLIFNLYVFAHQNLIFALTAPLYMLLGAPYFEYLLVYLGLSTLYYAYAATGTFKSGPISTLLRSVLLAVISYLIYWVLIGTAAALAIIHTTR